MSIFRGGGGAGGGPGESLLWQEFNSSIETANRIFRNATAIVVKEDPPPVEIGEYLWQLGGLGRSVWSYLYKITNIAGTVLYLDPALIATVQAATTMYAAPIIGFSDFDADPVVDRSITIPGAPQNIKVKATYIDLHPSSSGIVNSGFSYTDGYVIGGEGGGFQGQETRSTWQTIHNAPDEKGWIVVGQLLHSSNKALVADRNSAPDFPDLFYDPATGKLFFHKVDGKTYDDRVGWHPAVWDIQVFGG